tara:strand:+ start:4088 stop:4516 length:429 start_codon:yes stop_codon:yes gene_type:complete
MCIEKKLWKDQYPLMRNRLAEWREKRGYTQEKLAELVGISRVHINRLENAKTPLSDKNKERFAVILGCQPEDLSMFGHTSRIPVEVIETLVRLVLERVPNASNAEKAALVAKAYHMVEGKPGLDPSYVEAYFDDRPLDLADN